MLTKEEIIKIARLSRLQLTEEEIVKYQNELSGVFDFFEMLKEVDTNGVEPTYQVTGLEDVLRKDIVIDYEGDLLACSPQNKIGTQVSVPNVF